MKPTNQASRESSVVPVLPATWCPGRLAAVPVPAVTTPRSIDLMAAAVCGDMACRDRGWFSSSTLPSRSTTRVMKIGCRCSPALA
ncbi:MAG: hypothetical protein HY319_31450 [Armatimonadetes bacterium]|nr:hypothetical protein [Armatimonadota bacterium]